MTRQYIKNPVTDSPGREPDAATLAPDPELQPGELALNRADTPPTLWTTDGISHLQVGPVIYSAVQPTYPKNGTIWIDPANDISYVRINDAWRSLTTSPIVGHVERREISWTNVAGQTTFNWPGHDQDALDVMLNGSKLVPGATRDYTSDGDTITLASPVAAATDVLVALTFAVLDPTVPFLRTEAIFDNVAGQTVFNFAHDPGALDVYYNGSLLVDTEYTTAGGSTTWWWRTDTPGLWRSGPPRATRRSGSPGL